MAFPSPCGEEVVKLISSQTQKKRLKFPSPCGEEVVKLDNQIL